MPDEISPQLFGNEAAIQKVIKLSLQALHMQNRVEKVA
jgi:hypothetical protein